MVNNRESELRSKAEGEITGQYFLCRLDPPYSFSVF